MSKTFLNKPAILGGEPIKTGSWPKWPYVTEEDIDRVVNVLRHGKWNRSGYSDFSDESHAVQFERQLCHVTGIKYALACANGTAAIEIGLRATGLPLGSEVIVPAYTFVASATAVLQVGALPVFSDIEHDTYNIDVKSVEQLINPNTRAIVAVHMGGRPFDIDAIGKIAKKHGLILLEDCAQAIGATWKGQSVGGFGDVGTFSFQNSKNMSSGEGGAVVTNNYKIAEMAYSLHHIGRKVGGKFYEHYYAAWNYRITEMQAAILLGQIDRLEEQTRTRNKNGEFLNKLLMEIDGIKVPPCDKRITSHGYHLYLFQIEEEKFGLDRDLFIKSLRAENIPCSSGYPLPLYKNPLFQEKNFGNKGYIEGRTIDYKRMYCPVAEKLVKQTVSFPQFILLSSRSDMEHIAEAIYRIKKYAVEIKKSEEGRLL